VAVTAFILIAARQRDKTVPSVAGLISRFDRLTMDCLMKFGLNNKSFSAKAQRTWLGFGVL
jgi:hypothetical protein